MLAWGVTAASVLLWAAPAQPDLPQLKTRGTVRVLVFGTGEEEYLPRAGSPRARDRELLEEWAQREGLTLEVLREARFDRLFPRLLAGEADVVAHGLTVTDERKREVAFIQPIATVKHLLVGKRGAKSNPRKAAQLKGQTVVVHPGSAYAQSLKALGVPGLTLADAPEELDTEGVVYRVGRGELPLTVTDSHVFESIAAYNRDVEALFPVAEGKEIAWAVRPDSGALKASLDAFVVEKSLTAWASKSFTQDLDGIQKRGVLRLITWNDPVSYFAYRGQLFGFDYELAQMIAAKLKVRLDVVVPPRRELMVDWLLQGKGDLIAATFHPPADAKKVACSRPYLFTDVVQVGAGPLTLPRGSPLFAGLDAGTAPDEEDDEGDLIELVREGKLGATAVDRVLLDARAPLPPSVPITTLAAEQPIVFATRPANKKLAKAIDDFAAATFRGLEYNLLKKRYFEGNRAIEAARSAESEKSGQLSPFDALFKEHASRNGLDWRLLASQAFQESRFDPKAKSWAGAVGLFQLMPATAAELRVTRLEDPAQSIRAGADYLAQLSARVDPRVPLKDRLRFALAAYNVGFGHVEDAQRLAAERGLDPNRWFGGVEKALAMLERPAYYRRARHGYCRASEPVRYVAEIQNRYESYVKLVP